MNYESSAIQIVVMIVLIAAWGFWEYREREIRHKKALLDLMNNVEPKPFRAQSWGRVITTLTMAGLLMLAAAGGIVFTANIGLQYAGPVIVLLAELMLVAVLLLMMGARDIKILKKG